MATVPEQRDLTFNTIQEVVAEAERLAAGEVRTTGNHSFAEILNHLALSHDVASGRLTPPPPPFFMKLMRPIIRLFVFGNKPLKPGIKLPPAGESFFWPKADDVESALTYLKESADHYRTTGPVEKHPFFGNVTREQADSLNCRHGALHLSFVHPVQ